MRTLIYTTNAIENCNRGLRKMTKSKAVFPTDDALLKMFYLAMMDITTKWTGRRKDWGMIPFATGGVFRRQNPRIRELTGGR